ncbi:tsr1320 [Thermosynechococcus vestitus BP-1]|uniref:Tsr1320 protein n=1 Tax=Thermosynechococcus vestitus (strain NIES-2133 / IAM M-273 / BP-1) TaxID=197221 RepID=Q8DJA7_THEVB|nr:tsr1320 [Thermosynechococcus vestitus BP-1]
MEVKGNTAARCCCDRASGCKNQNAYILYIIDYRFAQGTTHSIFWHTREHNYLSKGGCLKLWPPIFKGNYNVCAVTCGD